MYINKPETYWLSKRVKRPHAWPESLCVNNDACSVEVLMIRTQVTPDFSESHEWSQTHNTMAWHCNNGQKDSVKTVIVVRHCSRWRAHGSPGVLCSTQTVEHKNVCEWHPPMKRNWPVHSIYSMYIYVYILLPASNSLRIVPRLNGDGLTVADIQLCYIYSSTLFILLSDYCAVWQSHCMPLSENCHSAATASVVLFRRACVHASVHSKCACSHVT